MVNLYNITRSTSTLLANIAFSSLLLLLINPHRIIKTVDATIYDIPCGDTAQFETAAYGAQPGDVILLAGNSCLYDMGSTYTLESADRFGKEDGIIIKGKGTKPEDTILRLFMYGNFDLSVKFDTLTLESNNYGGYGQIMEADSDRAFVFHRCILKSGATLNDESAIDAMSIYISFTNSKIISGSTNTNTVGIEFEDHAFLLDSEVSGFGVGLETYDSAYAEDDVQIFNTDLSGNDIDCQADAECPIATAMNPNTKKGKNKTIWKTMNKLQSCSEWYDDYYNENCYYLPLRIKFPRVNKAGETLAYRLPSAYPEPKPVWSASPGIGRPQYFQFYSTALLRRKNTGHVQLQFKKSVIDANFVDPTRIVVAYHNGKKWKNNFLPVQLVFTNNGLTEWYQIQFPKKRRLIGMVAFLEEV